MEQSPPAPPPDAGDRHAGGTTLLPAPARARAPERRVLGLSLRRLKPRSLVWYVFVGPAFGLLVLFVAYPTFETFRQSLYEQVGTEQKFAGTTQYSQLFHGTTLWHALENTVLLGVAYLV